jgi:hypothetical protein
LRLLSPVVPKYLKYPSWHNLIPLILKTPLV